MAGTLTVQGVVTVNIGIITQTTVLSDSGTIEPALTIDGMLTGTTAAARAEQHRVLTELVWYGRHAGGVHVASSNLDVIDGLYRMDYAGTFPRTGFPRARLTLRRLGGSPLGGNIVQRLRAVSTLTTNDYSITSTPRLALPVSATQLSGTIATMQRTGRDGVSQIVSAVADYALAVADTSQNECRVWDRAGDTGTDSANWVRVWSPDHVFNIPSDLVIENGLLRIIGITGGNNSSHRYFAWTGSAYTEITSSTSGDSVVIGAAIETATYTRIVIEDLTPWRVKVTFYAGASTSPWFFNKSIVLERGHPLAAVTLTAPSSNVMQLGFRGGGQWIFTKGAPLDGSSDMQRPALDDGVETGNVSLNAPEDNWVVSFTTKSATTGTLAIGAWASNALTYRAVESSGTGGFFVQQTGTTQTLHLGGVKYDTSSAQIEAETGTLTGGAVTSSTVSGASGAGNNQVTLSAVGARVAMTTNLASIGGTNILVLFRIAVSNTGGATAAVSVSIYNASTATELAQVTRQNDQFAAANTWYWQAVTVGGWNGTHTIEARAEQTLDNGIDFYVDQCLPIAIAGSATLMQVDDVAAEALTANRVLPVAARQVY